MEGFLTHWGYAAVALLGFLEACCVPIPSAITFCFAGVLAGEGYLNVFGVILVGTIAEFIGSFVAYGMGRAGGRPLVHRFGRYLLITRSDLDRAERFVAGRGVWAIPLGRVVPVVRTFVSIVAGFIEVPALLFGVLSLIGTAAWVTTMSLVGYGVGSAWQSVAHGIAVAGYGIAVVVVLAVAAFVVARRRDVRLARQRARRLCSWSGGRFEPRVLSEFPPRLSPVRPDRLDHLHGHQQKPANAPPLHPGRPAPVMNKVAGSVAEHDTLRLVTMTRRSALTPAGPVRAPRRLVSRRSPPRRPARRAPPSRCRAARRPSSSRSRSAGPGRS